MPRSTRRAEARKQIKARRWRLPPVSISQILAWADEHFERTGRWPNAKSGRVRGTHEEKWRSLDDSLRRGTRGLLKGDSLARLLWRARGVRNIQSLPSLSNKQILAWADDHHRQTGTWPNRNSGGVLAAPEEDWGGIASAIHLGYRGQPGNDSLPRLLARERGARNRIGLPPYSIKQILAWADQYHAEHKKWPNVHSGDVTAAPGETWTAVGSALAGGTRGLPGGDSLPRLLARHRRVRNRGQVRRLALRQILGWVDAHFARHGTWPTRRSGPIDDAPGETWFGIHDALRGGGRGLRPGSSLPRLLKKHRGVRRHVRRPQLTIEAILKWADAFHRRHGRWPKATSGEIPEAQGETWSRIQFALYGGKRGLPRGWSLARLLMAHRGVRNVRHLSPLRIKQILDWVDRYHKTHGCWPTRNSSPIDGASGETWSRVDTALMSGHRGLPGGSSLARLLDKHRR